MGKQINYALDYESFVKVAQKALALDVPLFGTKLQSLKRPAARYPYWTKAASTTISAHRIMRRSTMIT